MGLRGQPAPGNVLPLEGHSGLVTVWNIAEGGDASNDMRETQPGFRSKGAWFESQGCHFVAVCF